MDALPPPHDDAEPGWYVDPMADDMLRWWDGAEWSETEFKLVKPPFGLTEGTKVDVLLGSEGRIGSVANVVICAILIVGLIVFWVNQRFDIWLALLGLLALVGLEIFFVRAALKVRRDDLREP
ncbi:DUF2510 domain-containing protein [Amnibacterium flavum]|nr:DUF2510 domain-containing protein [Amnibacterium flavum]